MLVILKYLLFLCRYNVTGIHFSGHSIREIEAQAPFYKSASEKIVPVNLSDVCIYSTRDLAGCSLNLSKPLHDTETNINGGFVVILERKTMLHTFKKAVLKYRTFNSIRYFFAQDIIQCHRQIIKNTNIVRLRLVTFSSYTLTTGAIPIAKASRKIVTNICKLSMGVGGLHFITTLEHSNLCTAKTVF